MNIFKKPAVYWGKNADTTEYNPVELAVMTVCDYAAWSLLMYAVTAAIADVWNELTISEIDTPKIWFVRILCAILFGIGLPYLKIKIKGRFNKYIIPGASFLSILLTIACGSLYFVGNSTVLTSGFYSFAGSYMASYGEYHDLIFLIPEGNTVDVSAFFTFAVIVLTVFMWALSTLLSSKIYWILMPLIVFFAEFAAGKTPEWGAAGSLFVGALIILTHSRIRRRTGHKVSKRRYRERLFAKVEFKQGAASIVASIVIIILVSIAFGGAAVRVASNSEATKQFNKDAERTIKVGIEYLKNRNTADLVDEITDKPPVFRDEKICSITTSGQVRGNIYQREYIGDTYENGLWHFNPQTFNKACEDADFDPATVREQLESIIYVGLTAGNPGKKVSYSMDYLDYITTSALAPYFSDITPGKSALNEDVLPFYNLFSASLEITGLNGVVMSTNDVINLSGKVYPDEEEEILNWYDHYVMVHYVGGSESVPTASEAAAYMKVKARKADNESINRWRMKMAEDVAILMSSYDFNWAMDATPEGMDVLEYFIARGHQGYNIHFASAATLILKEMGIPARYVRGYVVNGGKFKKNEDGTYSTLVLDRDLHAWTEIYLNHIGWVPIEVTPSYTIRDDYMKTGQETKKLRNKPSRKLSSSDSDLKPWEASVSVSEDAVEEATTGATFDWSMLNYNPQDKNFSENNDYEPMDSELPEDTDLNPDAPDYEETDEPDPDMGDEESPVNESAKESTDGFDLPGEVENGNVESDEGLGFEDKQKKDYSETFKAMLRAAGKLLGILAIIVLAVLAVLMFVGNRIRAHYKAQIEKEYKNGNYGEAVRKINRRIYLTLRFRGKIIKSYPSDNEYLAVLKEAYDKIPPARWNRFMEIAKEAGFSDSELSKDKAEFCYDLFTKLK